MLFMRFQDRTLNRIFPTAILSALIFLAVPGSVRGAEPSSSIPAAGKTSEMLDDLVSELLRVNPELQAAQASARVARAQAGLEGGLEAPQVGMDFFQIPVASFPDPGKNNLEIDYFAQQDVMFPGRLIALGTAENRRAAMREQEARMLAQRLVTNLKSAYYELYEVDRKLYINRQNLELMQQLQDLARKQYELGMGNQSDVLRAQTEFTSLQSTALILTQARESLSAELVALLNRTSETPWDAVPELTWSKQSWSLAQLKSLTEKNQPELQAAQWGVEMARAERGAAFWGFFPDFMAKGMYKDMRGMGDNFWSLMLGVTLPIAPWSAPKTVSRYQQTQAALEAAQANLRQTQNRVQAQLRQTLGRVNANQALAELTEKTLLVQAEQTLQSTLAAYQTGKRDFMTLLDAYRLLWMARENRVMAVKNLMTSLADLEQAVGLNLEEIQKALQDQKVESRE
ncbi:MAG: TolC family protein [Candidatus Firestonebacteria bacterium]|nr:TolC family protein [Candidatus Firestonebacteria bacterium]